MALDFPTNVADGYEYIYTDPEGAKTYYYWKDSENLWYPTTERVCGGGITDDIDPITVTITNSQASWTTFNGTYAYVSTTVYVSKSVDFTNTTDGYTWVGTDSTVTSTYLLNLDFAQTYYARVSHTDAAGNTRFSDPVSFTSASDMRDTFSKMAAAIQGSNRLDYLLTGGRQYDMTFDNSDEDYPYTYISDGGNDMFDSGNFVIPCNTNLALPQEGDGIINTAAELANYGHGTIEHNQTTTQRKENFVWVSGGMNKPNGNSSPWSTINQEGPLISAMTCGPDSTSSFIGWMTSGDSGADNNGSSSASWITTGTDYRQFRYSAWVVRTNDGTGTNDPPYAMVYVFLGSGDFWGSNWGSNSYTTDYASNTGPCTSKCFINNASNEVKNIVAVKFLQVVPPANSDITNAEVVEIIENLIDNVWTEYELV